MWNVILEITVSKYENRGNPGMNPKHKIRIELDDEPGIDVIRALEDSHNKAKNPTSAVVVSVFECKDSQV